jgi:hypothetical protein
MKQITWACLCTLLTACAAPELEATAATARAPAAAEVRDAEMLAEPVIAPEICDDVGDGIGGTGCPVD